VQEGVVYSVTVARCPARDSHVSARSASRLRIVERYWDAVVGVELHGDIWPNADGELGAFELGEAMAGAGAGEVIACCNACTQRVQSFSVSK
jgi:hypothetical protein